MDLSEIEAELAEIERKESAIDGKIGQLLRDQHNVNDSLSSVFQISKQLTAVDSDVETLHDKLKDTAALSDKISKRVGIEYREKLQNFALISIKRLVRCMVCYHRALLNSISILY